MKLELNGLKIAQDKTFADCARYMFTTLLSLGLPATAAGLGFEHRQEFAALFPKDVPSAGTQVWVVWEGLGGCGTCGTYKECEGSRGCRVLETGGAVN